MGNKGVQRKKRTTGSNKRISSELSVVKCEQLNWGTPAYNWKIDKLNGTIEEQKKALLEELMKIESGEKRKHAVLSLLDANGNDTFKSASILAIKESGVDISLATLLDKGLKGIEYSRCLQILENAGVELSEETKEKIKMSCDKANAMDISLYSVKL